MSLLLIKQPSAYSFAGNPILVQAQTTLTDKTFLRIVMDCNVQVTDGSASYSYSESYSYFVGEDGKANFNVSPTVKAALEKYEEMEVSGTTVTQRHHCAVFSLSLSEVYLDGMVEVTGDELTSQSYNACTGRMTEYERMFTTTEDTATIIGQGRILSRKPEAELVPIGADLYIPAVSTYQSTISGSVTQGGNTDSVSAFAGRTFVPVSLRVPTASLSVGEFAVFAANDRAKSKFAVEETPDMRHFLFRNGFGVLESVTAFVRESFTYKTESEQYVIPGEIGFKEGKRVVSYSEAPYAYLEMSSGYTSLRWADWWVNEFATTRKAWMKVENRFVPVAIVPEESSQLYDRSKPGLIAVNFMVRFAFAGGTMNAFS